MSKQKLMSKDLKDTVAKFVKAFDGADWAKVETLLDDDVVLTKVDDIKPPIIGKAAVMAYMRKDCEKDRPQFSEIIKHTKSHETGSHAVIKGLANYIDCTKPNPTPLRVIRYLFILRHDGPKNWLFRLLYGKLV